MNHKSGLADKLIKVHWYYILSFTLCLWLLGTFLLSFKFITSLPTMKSKPMLESMFYQDKANTSCKMREVSKRFTRRHIQLLQACKGKENLYRGHYPNNRLTEHLYVYNNTNLVIFCGIEKVGVKIWRRIFMTLNNPTKFASPYDISPIYAFDDIDNLRSLSSDKKLLDQKMQLAQTVVFTRNPFEKLYSTYMDKLLNVNSHFMSLIGSKIMKNYRQNASKVDLNCGHNVTFKEFVHFYVDHENQKDKGKKDDHFMTMTEHCRPCDYKYKYIGKTETFFEDLVYISKTLKFHFSVEELRRNLLTDIIRQTVEILFDENDIFPAIQCFSLKFALDRAWFSLQARGLISNIYEVPFMNETETRITKKYLFVTFEKYVNMSLVDNNLKQQKKDYLIKAYSTLSPSLKKKLQLIFQADCNIFGYDCMSP